jgi:hypothetical protein
MVYFVRRGRLNRRVAVGLLAPLTRASVPVVALELHIRMYIGTALLVV